MSLDADPLIGLALKDDRSVDHCFELKVTTTTMIVLKTIAITLDVIFTLIIAYFLVPLKWEYESERASIIGFWWMIATFILNGALVALL